MTLVMLLKSWSKTAGTSEEFRTDTERNEPVADIREDAPAQADEAVKDEVQEVAEEDRLAALKAEAERNFDGWQRTMANFRLQASN